MYCTEPSTVKPENRSFLFYLLLLLVHIIVPGNGRHSANTFLVVLLILLLFSAYCLLKVFYENKCIMKSPSYVKCLLPLVARKENVRSIMSKSLVLGLPKGVNSL